MKLLIAAATAGEIAPLLSHIQSYRVPGEENGYNKKGHHFSICLTGVGGLAATHALTKMLSGRSFDLALQAGIAGAFGEEAAIGSVWRVKNEMLADLGAERADGTFMDLFDLGLCPKDQFPFQDKKLRAPDLHLPGLDELPAADAITVDTVSGTAATARERMATYQATLESMEGAAFHYVCLMEKVPFIQLRSVSNQAGIRDKSTWDIPLAVKTLNEVLIKWADRLPLP